MLYVAGLAYYRAGEWELAKDVLHRATQDDPGWHGRVLAPLPLAMAHFQLGDKRRARSLLEDAQEQFDDWRGQLARGPIGVTPLPWFDWIEYLVLYREAGELIAGELPSDNPRLAEIEQRALAAISGDEEAAITDDVELDAP